MHISFFLPVAGCEVQSQNDCMMHDGFVLVSFSIKIIVRVGTTVVRTLLLYKMIPSAVWFLPLCCTVPDTANSLPGGRCYVIQYNTKKLVPYSKTSKSSTCEKFGYNLLHLWRNGLYPQYCTTNVVSIATVPTMRPLNHSFFAFTTRNSWRPCCITLVCSRSSILRQQNIQYSTRYGV